jgi:hypothetical protein
MTNTSERLAKRILGGTLAGSGWAFAMKIRLQDVLVLDGLHGDDYLLYTTGHCDFVVCRSSDDIPVFAIEIDGLSHEDPKQIKRDIIKNRLCATAGLPLIRLGIDALDESQEISILECSLSDSSPGRSRAPRIRATASPLSSTTLPFRFLGTWSLPNDSSIALASPPAGATLRSSSGCGS